MSRWERFLALALCATALPGCHRAADARSEAARLETLRTAYARLHDRLEGAVAREPLVNQALADRGKLVIAIRSKLIEDVASQLARAYLDRVSVDLTSVDAQRTGEIGKKTPLGKVKIGDWRVYLKIGKLAGRLQAGEPRVSLRAPDLIAIDLPIQVEETAGTIAIQLSWDSASLANAVCKDFELARELSGSVPRQTHVLSGAWQVSSAGDTLSATPLFAEHSVPLNVELKASSWAVVEEALKTQNSLGTCGILMHPEKGVEQLRELAAKGIDVELPKALFRVLRLPAQFGGTVQVHDRALKLVVKTETLRVTPEMLWSSASLRMQSPSDAPAR